jgi:hypothetical protein
MGLEEDVSKVVRDAVAKTSIGMAAWVGAEQGIAEQVAPREGETEIEALRRISLASRELTQAMLSGQLDALRLLAREIEALRDSVD